MSADRAIVARTKLEVAAKLMSEAGRELRDILPLDMWNQSPSIVTLDRASNTVSKALAHLAILIKRLP